MTRCPVCHNRFPDWLVAPAMLNGQWKKMCPLCYGKAHKQIHGVEWEPYGDIAASMLEEAKELYPEKE